MDALWFVGFVALMVVVGVRAGVRRYAAESRRVDSIIADGLADIDCRRWEAEL